MLRNCMICRRDKILYSERGKKKGNLRKRKERQRERESHHKAGQFSFYVGCFFTVRKGGGGVRRAEKTVAAGQLPFAGRKCNPIFTDGRFQKVKHAFVRATTLIPAAILVAGWKRSPFSPNNCSTSSPISASRICSMHCSVLFPFRGWYTEALMNQSSVCVHVWREGCLGSPFTAVYWLIILTASPHGVGWDNLGSISDGSY